MLGVGDDVGIVAGVHWSGRPRPCGDSTGALTARAAPPSTPCVAPRGIQPFHCPNDGDILYAVSTHEVPLDADTDVQLLGTLASEVCYDAILSIVA